MGKPSKKCTFYGYAACGTCKKAKAWLKEHGVAFDEIPIVDAPPSAAELAAWIPKSGVPARKWFNTSGQSYRALVAKKGKDAVAALGDAAVVELLARDGKLIKRPLLVTGKRVLVGFDDAAYRHTFIE